MERYTNEQRILIVKLFYQNGESFAATVRKLRSIWGHNNAPKESTVKRLMDKFAETGSVSDVKTTTRHRPGRSTENVAAVRPKMSQLKIHPPQFDTELSKLVSPNPLCSEF